MAEKKRRYCRNTVKGKRRGSKWPEELKTAAICDLLVNNNICAVARKYQVPESTLRTWMAAAEKSGADGKRNLFEEARRNALRQLNHRASAGAVASVEYIGRRLEINAKDAEIYEENKNRLAEAQNLTEEEKSQSLAKMELHKPMSDFAAAGYMRALQSVAERTGRILDENDTDKLQDKARVNVVFSGGDDVWQ